MYLKHFNADFRPIHSVGESCHMNYCKKYLFSFLGELAPATAFMTGKVKVSGDLSKALTLEKVMKATREAAEANRNKQG